MILNASDVLTFRPMRQESMTDTAPFDSMYVERFWLPVLGATQICLLRQVGYQVKAGGLWQIQASELAARLGLGSVTGSPHRPLAKSMKRLCDYKMMTEESGGAFQARLMMPMLSTRQRQRLPLSLRSLHARILEKAS